MSEFSIQLIAQAGISEGLQAVRKAGQAYAVQRRHKLVMVRYLPVPRIKTFGT